MNGEQCGINRFEPVLAALKKTNNPMLQLACLQFINAIVNTPDDIDFKIHLRNEFMRGGLDEVLNVSSWERGREGGGGDREGERGRVGCELEVKAGIPWGLEISSIITSFLLPPEPSRDPAERPDYPPGHLRGPS